MEPKPDHLGVEYASQFKDTSIVEAYKFRPGYPPDLFERLSGLIGEAPRRVLDIGCGTGYVARDFIGYVDQIDAVDFSAAMLAEAKRLPNGEHPDIRWIHSSLEEAELNPPYAMVTAGASLHWMDWSIVLPKIHQSLTPDGLLAILGVPADPPPWQNQMIDIITRYSTNRAFRPYNLIAMLEQRHLFYVRGHYVGKAVKVRQSVEHYIESIHARNGFSRDRMEPEAAWHFDKEMRELLDGYEGDGYVEFTVRGAATWGDPAPGLV